METKKEKGVNTNKEQTWVFEQHCQKAPSEKYLVPSTAHLGARHQNTTALGGAILLFLRDIDTGRAPNFGTGTPHPISTFLAPNLLNTFGTVMAPNVLNIGTVMAQGHHLPRGTLLAPNCLLYGTSLAPAWALSGHLAGTKKYLLLSGTFLAPYWHQFCSAI